MQLVVLHQLVKPPRRHEREVRSHGLPDEGIARFPAHRDLAGVRLRRRVACGRGIWCKQPARIARSWTRAQNVVLMGGPGTGKTHLATSLGRARRSSGQGKRRVRFFSTVELVNALELEKSQNKHGPVGQSLDVCGFGDLG
jgi:Cdc6-like AAA superfamily ATPase